jgi:hypothetical protein
MFSQLKFTKMLEINEFQAFFVYKHSDKVNGTTII